MMQGDQIEFSLLAERLGYPAVLVCGGFDIMQHGADVNRLAVVTTVIFAELLHEGNFTQSRGDAKEISQTYH